MAGSGLMSGTGRITIVWGGDEREFRLAIGQLRRLQEKTGAGPMAVATRLAGGTFMVDDVRESIRLGLIGGGMKPSEADELVKEYVDERPLLENVITAREILMAALVGDPNDEVGKGRAEGAATEATASPSPH